jgi:hypothetical protein
VIKLRAFSPKHASPMRQVRNGCRVRAHADCARGLFLRRLLPGVQGETAGSATQMKVHPLSPDVKCPVCGRGLVFVRVRVYGGLYRCAHGLQACRGAVVHYRMNGKTACGWAPSLDMGRAGWTECQTGE